MKEARRHTALCCAVRGSEAAGDHALHAHRAGCGTTQRRCSGSGALCVVCYSTLHSRRDQTFFPRKRAACMHGWAPMASWVGGVDREIPAFVKKKEIPAKCKPSFFFKSRSYKPVDGYCLCCTLPFFFTTMLSTRINSSWPRLEPSFKSPTCSPG